ncbi:RHS repeat-associated core domain-containing protein [Pseudomonas sp. C32]|uniref:RHS repeat domain-containing protein n=1 Tax=Pseudomonas sp. C32 TaxID=1529208 RepID=UPI002626C09B|nr:RHS repeat-associated core domain-containing protein [Pseudomonas sp. C32]MDN4547558.1 RHS repeat-associated core domain-containing protein [Pseudomonas sp. C32]
MPKEAVVSIYSSACNFEEFLSGGVDPRTGQYTFKLSIGGINSVALNGPSLGFNLQFNPLNTVDSGLGAGWALPLTRYDLLQQSLSLSSGDIYKVIPVSGGLKFPEQHVENFKVFSSAPGHYQLSHKSGLREELETFQSSDYAVPTRILAANGTSITLDYTLHQGNPRLTEVKDAERSLLKVTYDDAQVIFTKFPDTTCEAKFILTLANGRVGSISLPTGDEWHFTYENNGGLVCLTQVDSAMGSSESIQYVADGHAFPSASPFSTLPHVTAHTLFPGGDQPAIVTEYEFSQQNFLGFNGAMGWSEELDNLSAAPDDYRYTSTVNLMRGSEVHRSTVRTYNKYHLLLCEETRCGQATHSLMTQYHLSPGKHITDQPPQFRLPLVQTRRYKNHSTGTHRDEVTRTEFDEYGNLLRQVDPSGVTTVSEFFPVSKTDDCPADPLGFVRFEKQRTVYPAKELAAAPITVTRYGYKLLDGVVGSKVKHVLPVKEQFYERTTDGETLCLQSDLQYFELPDKPHLHGQLKKQTRTCQTLETHCEFSYSLQDETRSVQTTVSGFDGIQTAELRAYSTLSGALLSAKDEEGVSTDFDYDAIGRPLTETVAPGTKFEAKRHSSYTVATSKSPTTLLNTDANGVQQRVTYDGIGRVVKVEEQDSDASADGPLRAVYSARYDSIGQLVEETRTDWLEGVALPLKQSFIFDDWGQLLTTVSEKGRRQHVHFDPVSRKESRWTEGGGKTVTLSNDFAHPVSVEVFDRKGQSLGKTVNVYDGLGRTVSQTDPVGNTTTYSYDVFSRLKRSVLPDGASVETQYAAHSHLPLPIEVKVGAHPLGKQTFDGLSRLTRSEAGGRQTVLQYEASAKRPSIEVKPDGERVQYSYEPNLGGKVVRRQILGPQSSPLKGTGLRADYSYDSRLGALISCSEQGYESRFEYSRSGKLQREISTLGDEARTATYTHSLAGRPLLYTDVLGNEHKTTYDDQGRPKSLMQNQVEADFDYNSLGQLEAIHTHDRAKGHSLVTRLLYDDLGREVSRSFDSGGADLEALTSRYTLANKLAQRTLKAGDKVLRDELFSYDVRGRLKEYRCEGTQKARDFQGNEIIRQTFVFDELDNVLTLETEFPGSTNLATYTYSPIDPTQLVEIAHSHEDYPATVTLQYDANGQLVRDEQARTLTYDSLGRLKQVAAAQGAVLRGFGYDALDQLVNLSSPEKLATQRYYRAGQVAHDVCGSETTTRLCEAGVLLGHAQSGQNASVRLSVIDQQQTVLGEVIGDKRNAIAYSPYGHSQATDGMSSLSGFNAEPFDPLTGLYLLGNGYRAYSPALMRFHSPDSLSPFGAGGLNPYAYCLSDPINRIDPTGHFSWQSILGIALSIVGVVASFATFGAATPLAILGIGLGTVSALTGIAGMVATEVMPSSVVGEVLGWVSVWTGLGAFTSGGLAASKAFTQWGSKLLTSPPTRVSQFGYRPGALAGGGRSSAKSAKGAGRGSQAPSTSAQAARPERWTLIDEIGGSDLTPNGKPGNVARGKFADFKSGIESGMSPHESSRAHLGNSYDPYPGYSGYNRIVSDIKAQNQAAVSAAKKAKEVPTLISEPAHVHARLGGFDRVFFLEYRTEMRVVIKQIGGHDPQW